MVVPSPPFFRGPRHDMEPLSKESLRSAALEARKAFVRTLSDGGRAKLEQRLAEHLTSLFAGVSVVGGYCPLGSEISPMPAMEELTRISRRAFLRKGRIKTAVGVDLETRGFRSST